MSFKIIINLMLLVMLLCVNIVQGAGQTGGGLTVTVAYEALDCNSYTLFKSIDGKTIDELSKCGIKFKFLPCSTSSVINGHLQCFGGADECAFDKIYACATEHNQCHEDFLGKFVICMMNGGKGENCAKQSNISNWGDIEICSKNDGANQICHKYWTKINQDMQITAVPGIMFSNKFDKQTSDDAVNDFKGVVCHQAKEKGINCAICGSCGGNNEHNNPGGTPPPHSGNNQNNPSGTPLSPHCNHGHTDGASSPSNPSTP